METRRTSAPGTKSAFWMLFVVFAGAGAAAGSSHPDPPLSVAAAHLYYSCPEGATAKLVCQQKNARLYPKEHIRERWLFTPHTDQLCIVGQGPRFLSHGHREPAGLRMEHTADSMWVILQNVTYADQGRYCCISLEVNVSQKHTTVLQNSHSHLILHVTPRRDGPANCTFWDTTPPAASVPVALALAACILALLSLPLILVLVYKQRQNSHSNRRGQELVRMDSEAQGHENPVFLGGSPQTKTRTVSQILTRQASETGRHLLSDPGTPLSPPTHGDVFFPSEDPLPESPDLVQI